MRIPDVASSKETLARVGRHRIRFSLGALVIVLAAVAVGLLFSQGGGEPAAAKGDVPQAGTVSVEPVVNTNGPAPPTYNVTWSAKFVCYRYEYSDPPYYEYRSAGLAAINVHNPTDGTVSLTKKVVPTLPEVEWVWMDPYMEPYPLEPATPSGKVPVALGPDEAFEIDCEDIYWLYYGTPWDGSYFEGFAVIGVPGDQPLLDVVAVYTNQFYDAEDYYWYGVGLGQSEDVEQVTPKLQQYPPEEEPTFDPAYVYSAKFVCGWVDPVTSYQPVAPGNYWTTINIHNFTEADDYTVILKKIVIEPPERYYDEGLAPLIFSVPFYFGLYDDQGFQVDCEEIWMFMDYYGLWDVWPYELSNVLKGYAVIYSTRELDVTAFYDAEGFEYGFDYGVGIGLGNDVEEVPYTRNTLPMYLEGAAAAEGAGAGQRLDVGMEPNPQERPIDTPPPPWERTRPSEESQAPSTGSEAAPAPTWPQD